jgi:hypothetical protein
MDKTGPNNAAIFHLTYLGSVTDQIRALEDAQRKYVELARENGASWRMVGVALGTTTQAAWTRFRAQETPNPVEGQDTLGDF